MNWYMTRNGNRVYWRGTVQRMSWLAYWLLRIAARVDGRKPRNDMGDRVGESVRFTRDAR